MELSPPVPLSRGLASLSSDGELLATASGKQLEIRSVESMETLHAIELSSAITCLSWGAVRGETAVAAGSTGTHSLVIVAAETGEIIADVFVGEIGVVALSLSRAGFLLAFAETGLGATIVDILKGEASGFVPCTKTGVGALPLARAHAWAPGGRFVALVTRDDDGVADAVIMVDCRSARVVMRAPAGPRLADIADVAGVRWLAPTALLVWGGARDARGHAALALLAPDGRLLRAGPPRAEDTRAVPEDVGLGIRSVATAHGGRLMAVGGWDGVLRLSSVMPWREVARFDHARPIFDPAAPPAVFRETCRAHRRLASSFELVRSLDDVVIGNPDSGGGAGKEGLKLGVAIVEFSHNGEFLASAADSARNVVFIWEVAKLRLAAVLVLLGEVASVKWATAPDGPVCVMVSGGDHAFVWKRAGAAALRVDEGWKRRERRPVALKRVVSHGAARNAIVVDAGSGTGGVGVGVYFV